MGLGPPVCLPCKTEAFYTTDDERGRYYCPSCGDRKNLEHLWEFDQVLQEEMIGNSKFWRAIKQGKDMIEQEKKMITEKQGEGKIDVDADIAYFKKKLAEGLANGEDVTKLERQISLLEDAMVTYQLTGQR